MVPREVVKLHDYQSSVELMYENTKDLNPVHGELVAESPVLGRVPEANAVLDDQHHGQPVRNFTLKVAGRVGLGIVPAP